MHRRVLILFPFTLNFILLNTSLILAWTSLFLKKLQLFWGINLSCNGLSAFDFSDKRDKLEYVLCNDWYSIREFWEFVLSRGLGVFSSMIYPGSSSKCLEVGGLIISSSSCWLSSLYLDDWVYTNQYYIVNQCKLQFWISSYYIIVHVLLRHV